MLIVAHRGDVQHYPENTREGILAAAAMSPDGIEMDVLPSADGTWYVMHNRDAGLTTNGTGSFTEMSDADIARLRIAGGLGYVAERDSGRYRVPLLRPLLEDLATFSGFLVLDVKSMDPDDHADVARLAVDAGRGDRVSFICRTLAGCEAIKAVADVPTMALSRVTDQPGGAVDTWLAGVTAEILWPPAVWLRPPGASRVIWPSGSSAATRFLSSTRPTAGV